MSLKNLIVIGSFNYANRRLLHEAKAKGYDCSIIEPSRLLPFINNNVRDRIYITRKDPVPRRIYKNSLDAIIPRIGRNLQFYSNSVEQINNNLKIPSTASAEGLLNAQDKVRTTQLLSQAGVKTPKTVAINGIGNFDWIVKELGGFPIVGKTLTGSQGNGVFLLTEAVSAKTAVQTIISQGTPLLLQQFIETSKDSDTKHDFRAVVVDGQVVASIKRSSTGNDFRTNASIIENCEGVELSQDLKEVAIKAAAAVGLKVAGVDIAVDAHSKEIYVYEVNGNMNFKSTEKYSKKNVAKAIVEYAIQISNKESGNFSTIEKEDPYRVATVASFENEITGIPFLEFTDDTDDVDNITDCEYNSKIKIGTNTATFHFDTENGATAKYNKHIKSKYGL